MLLEDMLKLHIPAQFGTNEDYDITAPIDYILRQLDRMDGEVRTAWGVSQFVIINDNWDEVIKIPFCGGYAFHAPDDWEEDSDWIEVWEDWTHNYCKLSVDIYNKAKKFGIAPIFAETKLFGTTVEGVKIYTQEKVANDYASSDKSNYTEDSLNKVKSRKNLKYAGWGRFCSKWLAKAIDCYGLELVDKFIKFCVDNNICDTHIHNYGYRADGSPVIFDYASFDE